MKGGVVDLFIAKDRIAIFWFMMASITAVVATVFTSATIREVRKSPQYIYLDGAGTWYISPSHSFQDADYVHTTLSRLATETIFSRTPDGLVTSAPIERLFGQDAQEIIDDELKREARAFSNQEISQTVEIQDVKVLARRDNAASTGVTAELIRVGEFKGAELREVFELKVQYIWRQNPRMNENGMFPAVCVDLNIRMNKTNEFSGS